MDIGNSADIHIHRAQRDAVLLLGKDVAFALDGPFTREVHNVRGHAGAANLQNIGNLMRAFRIVQVHTAQILKTDNPFEISEGFFTLFGAAQIVAGGEGVTGINAHPDA